MSNAALDGSTLDEYVLRGNTLVRPGYVLPQYDLGYTVGYRDNNGELMESEVVSIWTDSAFDGSTIEYELANGEILSEEDVLHFYPVEYESEE